MRRLKHIFNYIFYIAYTKEEKRWASAPVLQGLISISLLINIYLFITTILIETIFEIPIFSLPIDDLFPFIIIITSIVILINYFIYGYKKKYTAIIEKYKAEDQKSRKKNQLTVTLFVILSLISLVVTNIVVLNY